MEDTVHEVAAVIQNSSRVTLVKEDGTNQDVSNWFRRTLSPDSRTITFKNLEVKPGTTEPVIPSFENSTLRFEFDAKVVVSTARLVELLKRDGYVTGNTGYAPNTAFFTLNDKPENRIETNEVRSYSDLVSVKFTKRLEGETEGTTLPLPEGQSATFDVYRLNAGTEEKIREEITTNKYGEVIVPLIEGESIS